MTLALIMLNTFKQCWTWGMWSCSLFLSFFLILFSGLLYSLMNARWFYKIHFCIEYFQQKDYHVLLFFIIPFLCSFFFAFVRGGGVNNHKDYMIAIINNIKFRLIAELHTHFEFWNYKRVQYRIKSLECFKVNKKCSIKYLGLFLFCSLLWLYANSAFKMLAIGHRLHYFKWDLNRRYVHPAVLRIFQMNRFHRTDFFS